MNVRRTVVSAAALMLSAALLPASAAPSAQTGKENAAARIEEAMAGQTEILTGLLAKLPAQALPAVQDALEASRRGHETALAALSGQTGTESTAGKITKAREQNSGENATTGLTLAREAVASAFEKSVATLQDLLGKLPEEAVPHVEAALASVQEHRAVALQNLEGLIAVRAPDRATVIRPDRPQRPDRPERVERPEVIDRPQVPDRPARPDRPQVPERS